MKVTDESRGQARMCEMFSAEHLFLLYASLQRFYVVLHSHVDESVLGFSLHHPRALRSNHLDGLWHVDVAIHPCSIETIFTLMYPHNRKYNPDGKLKH